MKRCVDKTGLEYVSSIINTLIFSFVYGWMEAKGVVHDVEVISKVIFLGFKVYHLFPMFVLAVIVCGAPFWDDLIYKLNPVIEKVKTFVLMVSNVLLFALVEDIMYFVFAGIPIRPWEWTARWGYFDVGFTVIPYWYVASAVVLTFLYMYVLAEEWLKKVFGGCF